MDLLGIALPRRCAACDLPGRPLCERCVAALVRIGPPVCDRCGCPGAWPVRRCAECVGRRLAFACARSAILYDSRARPLVSAWKERGRRDLATALSEIVAEVVARPEVDALTFVPGDRGRGRERGHVPAERLAEGLGERWGIEVRRLLARRRSSPRQASLPRSARGANVRGAFVASQRAPPRIALVDDVYTTGATVSACATELRRSGARRVEVVCLARAVR